MSTDRPEPTISATSLVPDTLPETGPSWEGDDPAWIGVALLVLGAAMVLATRRRWRGGTKSYQQWR